MEKIKNKAYTGKKFEIDKVTYILLPEKSKGCCKGCDLISTDGCKPERTDYCRQGFIFKRFKG